MLGEVLHRGCCTGWGVVWVEELHRLGCCTGEMVHGVGVLHCGVLHGGCCMRKVKGMPRDTNILDISLPQLRYISLVL